MTPNDYFDILFRHKELERCELKKAKKLLFIDTESLTTLFFYKLTFEKTKEYDQNFENIAKSISILNNYDLYLFLEPEGTIYVDDGFRLGEDDRFINNQNLKELFKENNINYYSISGDYQERFEKAKQKVNKLIGR